MGYRWRNRDSGRVERGSLVTELPQDIQPGESVELSTRIHTPIKPGKYALIVEMFVRQFDWFSSAGVVPAVVLADVQPNIPRTVELVILPATRSSVAAPVPRSDLWRAAIKMFLAHPFGVGPDNYRLLYGRFLGLTQWNTSIYSNSLYLELLTGSVVFSDWLRLAWL